MRRTRFACHLCSLTLTQDTVPHAWKKAMNTKWCCEMCAADPANASRFVRKQRPEPYDWAGLRFGASMHYPAARLVRWY